MAVLLWQHFYLYTAARVKRHLYTASVAIELLIQTTYTCIIMGQYSVIIVPVTLITILPQCACVRVCVCV